MVDGWSPAQVAAFARNKNSFDDLATLLEEEDVDGAGLSEFTTEVLEESLQVRPLVTAMRFLRHIAEERVSEPENIAMHSWSMSDVGGTLQK